MAALAVFGATSPVAGEDAKPAVVSKGNVTRSRLRSMLDLFYGGAAGQLVLQLVKEESLSPEEISELQNLIDRLDRPPGNRSRGRRESDG